MTKYFRTLQQQKQKVKRKNKILALFQYLFQILRTKPHQKHFLRQ